MRWALPILLVGVILSGCRPGGDGDHTQPAPGTPGVGTQSQLPAGVGTHIFLKPVDQMNRDEVKVELGEISNLQKKLGQREEQLTTRDRQLVEEEWAMWLRISSASLFAIAVILMVLAVKLGWAITTFIKIALGLVAASAVCLTASFLVHYFLAIAICVLVGFGGYVLFLLMQSNWNARAALADAREKLAYAEDGVKVLAKSAGEKLDATAALADAEIHNNASLKELLVKLGVSAAKKS